MDGRVINLYSLSKTYAMAGWRIAYLVADKCLTKHIVKAHYYIALCANSISQKAALAALLGPQDCVKAMVQEYDRRRKLIVNHLNKIEGIKCLMPKGAFYAFPNVSELGLSSEDLAKYLLKEGKVVTAPGAAFGKYGEGYLRLSYSTSIENINEAVKRLKIAIEKL